MKLYYYYIWLRSIEVFRPRVRFFFHKPKKRRFTFFINFGQYFFCVFLLVQRIAIHCGVKKQIHYCLQHAKTFSLRFKLKNKCSQIDLKQIGRISQLSQLTWNLKSIVEATRQWTLLYYFACYTPHCTVQRDGRVHTCRQCRSNVSKETKNETSNKRLNV